MTKPTPNEDSKRDAPPAAARPQGRGAAAVPSTASKTTEILQAASAGRPGPSSSTPAPSQGARVDAKSASGQSRPDAEKRSTDGAPSEHADRSQPQRKGGSRDESSRSSSGRDEGTVNAVRSLISSFEQIVKEIPRGSAARFEGVTEELAKARKALDQGSRAPLTSASGQNLGSAKPTSASRTAGQGGRTDRHSSPKDDDSSESPSNPSVY